METKLLIPGPEYRRAVELLAAMFSALNEQERKELEQAIGLAYDDESAWKEYLYSGGYALYNAVDNNCTYGAEEVDASKYVTSRVVFEALDWVRSLFQGHSFYASNGELVSRKHFAKRILKDIARIKLD